MTGKARLLVWLLALASPILGQVNFYSREREIAPGQAIASELEKSFSVVRHAELTNYFNRLAQALVSRSEVEKFPCTVTVVKDGSLPGNAPVVRFLFPYNAAGRELIEPLAVPRGSIFLPVRLIEAAENETQMAGLLAYGRRWPRVRRSAPRFFFILPRLRARGRSHSGPDHGAGGLQSHRGGARLGKASIERQLANGKTPRHSPQPARSSQGSREERPIRVRAHLRIEHRAL